MKSSLEASVIIVGLTTLALFFLAMSFTGCDRKQPIQFILKNGDHVSYENCSQMIFSLGYHCTNSEGFEIRVWDYTYDGIKIGNKRK